MRAPEAGPSGFLHQPDPLPNVLDLSASLVASWGEISFDGRTLSDLTDVHGLPLWRSVAVDLALYRVPQAILDPRALTRFSARARRRAAQVRHRLWRPPRAGGLLAAWPPGLRLAFISPSPYMERDILRPVMRAVSNAGRATAISVRTTPDDAVPGVVYDDSNSYWNDEVRAQVHSGTKSLARAARSILRNRGELPRLLDLESRAEAGALAAVFEKLFFSQLPILLRHALLARHMLERRPSIVISPDVADPITRVWIILAHEMGIPTLEIQFGSCGPVSTEWRFLVADRVAVWGDAARQVLLSHGVAPDRVAVTGSPRHDAMVRVDGNTVEHVRRQLKLPPERRIVLFASSIHQSEYGNSPDRHALEATQRTMFEMASAAHDWTLVVKPHPLELVGETKRRAGESRNILWAPKDHDIRELIAACDVFVSLGSTATMDAIVAHKPSICAAFPGWNWSDFFVRSGAVLEADGPAALRKHVSAALADAPRVLAEREPARTRFVAEWAFRADGLSADRIASLAYDLAASR